MPKKQVIEKEQLQLLFRLNGIIELICEHGIGHPIYHQQGLNGPYGIHGCDGCCQKDDFKLESEQKQVMLKRIKKIK